MVGVPLGTDRRFALVGSPSYLEHRLVPTHPHDLLHHHCIRFRFPSGRLYKWEFERGDTRIEVDVRGRLTLGNQLLMTQAAADGVGLAFVFEDFATALLDSGCLIRVLSEWCPSFPGFMLYYPRQRRMPSALRAFIDMVRTSSEMSRDEPARLTHHVKR